MNGVRGLSAQEVGVYTMLLCRIYEENGPVEYHQLRLATYCGMRVPTFESVVKKLVDLGKITIAENMLSNARAETEIAKRSDDLKNNSKAGKSSAEKRKQNQQNNPTGVQQAFNHTDTDTDTISSSSSDARDAFPQIAVGGSDADQLWSDLIAAVGLQNGQRLPAHWMPPSATIHVWRWVNDLGLTADQIIEVAKKNRAQFNNPPNGPKALDAAMARMAGELSAPKMQAGTGFTATPLAPKPPLFDLTKVRFDQ